MPQPFSRVLRADSWEYTFGSEAMDREPELAALFAKAIVQYATIESSMGGLLIKILHAHAKPGYAMFNSLTSAPAKAAALNAAAESMLTGTELRIFQIGRHLAARMAKQRNKLAHDLWGFSPQVPGALLTISPSALHEKEISRDDYRRGFFQGHSHQSKPEDLYIPDLNSIMVYRKSDFENLLSEFRETAMILGTLTHLLFDPSLPKEMRIGFPRARLLRQICAGHLFRSERSRLRASQKKTRATPP